MLASCLGRDPIKKKEGKTRIFLIDVTGFHEREIITPIAITDPATALPAQIFMWADHPERAFIERTSAAILILLSFLIVMNATAVYIRHKFEKKC